MVDTIWFWQRIISPHMAGLAKALAERGLDVTYVAEQAISQGRTAQGWQVPSLDPAELRFAPDARAAVALAQAAPPGSVHICQGFRGNGVVGKARETLAACGLRQWVIMETVDDSRWRGALKRLEYRRQIRRWRHRIEGVLAIGDRTPAWLAARGMPPERILPFAYFLSAPDQEPAGAFSPQAPFRFVFVGRLVALKRVDLLIDALGTLQDAEFELVVIGSGPLEEKLRAQAQGSLGSRVSWLGRLPQGEVPARLATADCLVLPSRYDGWGAVISEALMAGTPAICSDGCGAAAAVRASGEGGVFRAGDATALEVLLRGAIARGRQTPSRRAALVQWARCLSAEAGGAYLNRILDCAAECSAVPAAPWEQARDLPLCSDRKVLPTGML